MIITRGILIRKVKTSERLAIMSQGVLFFGETFVGFNLATEASRFTPRIVREPKMEQERPIATDHTKMNEFMILESERAFSKNWSNS